MARFFEVSVKISREPVFKIPTEWMFMRLTLKYISSGARKLKLNSNFAVYGFYSFETLQAVFKTSTKYWQSLHATVIILNECWDG